MRHPDQHESQFPLDVFCRAIVNFKRYASDNQPSLLMWERIPMMDFQELFAPYRGEHFLSDKPLDELLRRIQDPHGSIRNIHPEGLRISLVAMPCDINGLPFPKSVFQDSRNLHCQYLHILHSLPGDKHGLATGIGNMKPVPLLDLFPEEVINQCSFIIDYQHSSDHQHDGHQSTGPHYDADVKDYLYLVSQITKAYAALQRLLNPSHHQKF